MKKMQFVTWSEEEEKYGVNTSVTVETDAECLSDILHDSRCFLLACGHILKGEICINEDDE